MQQMSFGELYTTMDFEAVEIDLLQAGTYYIPIISFVSCMVFV